MKLKSGMRLRKFLSIVLGFIVTFYASSANCISSSDCQIAIRRMIAGLPTPFEFDSQTFEKLADDYLQQNESSELSPELIYQLAALARIVSRKLTHQLGRTHAAMDEQDLWSIAFSSGALKLKKMRDVSQSVDRLKPFIIATMKARMLDELSELDVLPKNYRRIRRRLRELVEAETRKIPVDRWQSEDFIRIVVAYFDLYEPRKNDGDRVSALKDWVRLFFEDRHRALYGQIGFELGQQSRARAYVLTVCQIFEDLIFDQRHSLVSLNDQDSAVQNPKLQDVDEQIGLWTSELPEREWQLLRLRFVNDLSNSQAARILGQTRHATNTMLEIALARLKVQGDSSSSASINSVAMLEALTSGTVPLNQREREVLTMKLREGKSDQEIGNLLGLSRQTITRVKGEAMAKIQAFLGQPQPSTPESPSKWAKQNPDEVRKLLSDSSEALTGHQRRVLHLIFFEGLTLPQVAERLGKSLESISVMKSQGLKRLRGDTRGGL